MREKAVLQYLRENPAFLRRNQSELTRMLRLAERDIIDLTGKQLAALRDDSEKMLRQLRDWYGNAAENERTLEFLHRLALRLLASPAKSGQTERILAAEAKELLGIKMCKVIDVKRDKVTVKAKDRRRLADNLGVLRTEKPLPSFDDMKLGKRWKVFLNIPVFEKDKLRAVVVFGSAKASDFPRYAQSDYAVRLAEIVAASLAREK